MAVPLAQQALTILEGAFGPAHPYAAYAHLALGLALRDQGKAAAAEIHLRQGLTSLAKALPPGHPQLALSKLELAAILADLGRLDEADTLLREALPHLQTLYGPGGQDVKRAQSLVALIARRRGSAVGASYRGESE